MQRSIWIGRDRREDLAFRVTQTSLVRQLREYIPVHALELKELQERGWYTRPMLEKDGRLIDALSRREDYDGSMSTDHAIGRFFVPQLAHYRGWALFMDGDMLARADVSDAFRDLDPSKAVYCVKHDHVPVRITKMDGQVQTYYARKNWSSFMIFNCEHISNKSLAAIVNNVPGRDLHRFCWLTDVQIGELDPKWNFLVGHSDASIDPAVVHFTEGTPDMPGYWNCDYSGEWWDVAHKIKAAA